MPYHIFLSPKLSIFWQKQRNFWWVIMYGLLELKLVWHCWSRGKATLWLKSTDVSFVLHSADGGSYFCYESSEAHAFTLGWENVTLLQASLRKFEQVMHVVELNWWCGSKYVRSVTNPQVTVWWYSFREVWVTSTNLLTTKYCMKYTVSLC